MDQRRPRRLLTRAAGLVVGRFVIAFAVLCGLGWAAGWAIDALRGWAS